MGEFKDGHFARVANVNRGVIVAQRQPVNTIDQIGDITETSCLTTIAKYGYWIPLQRLANKCGYNPTVIQAHTWSIGVKDSNDFRIQRVVPVVGHGHRLSEAFRLVVDSSRPDRVYIAPVVSQIELLKRATLCVTHAGLNTALESLAHGVPMVAIPIAYDQFGVAARIAYHGVGESLGFDALAVDTLHALIQRVLNTDSYCEKAQYFKNIIAQRRGLDVAAETIERAFEAALANCALELSRS